MKKLLLALLLLLPSFTQADDVSPSHVFVDGEILFAAQLNTMRDEIVNQVNNLTGENLSSSIAITTTGTANFQGNFSATGNVLRLGNGGSDFLYVDTPGGIEYEEASTWLFHSAQTVSGTWASLGLVHGVEIDGGTIEGVTMGTYVAPIVANIDINGGRIDGTEIGEAVPARGTFNPLRIGTAHQGDVFYDNGTDTARLTPGTSGYFLKTLGNSANPIWADSSRLQIFTSSGTFTVPSGITQVFITGIGAGGGGGGCSGGGSGSGGAGAGAYLFLYPYTVTPLANLTVTLNNGGAGGTTGGSNGSDGGTSIFDTITLNGGSGGIAAGNGGAGGLGTASGYNATASVATAGTVGGGFIAPGGNGAKVGGAASGAGGGSPFGAGANGVATPNAGIDGIANTGAGGSGAFCPSLPGGNNRSGGAGGKGFFVVNW